MQFVLGLAHYLLSVGQLMTSGYSILFDDKFYVIHDKKSRLVIATVNKAQNNMFSLEVSKVENYALVSHGSNEDYGIFVMDT